MYDDDLIMPMVDSMINGIYSQVSKINTETLSKEARIFLKEFREDLKNRKVIDKELGNRVVKTVVKYHYDTGDLVQPLIVELITVAFHAIEPYRKLFKHIVEYFILASIFAILTITDDTKEIENTIEQVMIAVFTNPIYEFNPHERKQIINITNEAKGYLNILNFFTKKFTSHLKMIDNSLKEGLHASLELCNATTEEFALINKENHAAKGIGTLKFFLNLGWPIMNINRRSAIKWFEGKTGFKVWPL